MLKKILPLFVVFVFVLSSFGCQTSTESSAVSESQGAEYISQLMKYVFSTDSSIIGVLPYASASGVRAFVPSQPVYSGGWWSGTNTYTSSGITYDFTYNFKIFTSGGEVTTPTALNNLNQSNITQIWTYTSIAVSSGGSSVTVKIGTDKTSNYLTYVMGSSINGPVVYEVPSNGKTVSTTINFSNFTVESDGAPNGIFTATVSENGSQLFSASVTCDGTDYATINIDGETYTANINDGSVVAASIASN